MDISITCRRDNEAHIVYVTCVLKPLHNIQHKSLHAHSLFLGPFSGEKRLLSHSDAGHYKEKKKCEKAAKFL